MAGQLWGVSGMGGYISSARLSKTLRQVAADVQASLQDQEAIEAKKQEKKLNRKVKKAKNKAECSIKTARSI